MVAIYARGGQGGGSGVLIDKDGYALTNFHVVQGAQTIEVVLGDQSRHSAKFIGADQRNDVALVKIEPGKKPLAVLPLGDSAALQVRRLQVTLCVFVFVIS